MKRIADVGRGTINLCRAYWNWVSQIVDNYKIPEKKFNEMVQKGHFKTYEEAERASKHNLKIALAVAPFIFLPILVWSISSKPANQSVIIQSTESLSSTKSEQPTKSSTSTQTQQKRLSQTVPKDFKEFLPPENVKLRDFILADAFLGGFLQNVWIGNASREELTARGFYINTLYRHSGEGMEPSSEAKGACSPIGFNGAFICGRGIMQPYQWGIQNDKAIHRLNVLEEGWSEQASYAPIAPEPITTQSTQLSSSTREGVLVAENPKAQINVRVGAGISFKSRHYGVVGDQVTIISSARGEDDATWYQIKFPVSGADGWVRYNFIKTKE